MLHGLVSCFYKTQGVICKKTPSSLVRVSLLPAYISPNFFIRLFLKKKILYSPLIQRKEKTPVLHLTAPAQRRRKQAAFLAHSRLSSPPSAAPTLSNPPFSRARADSFVLAVDSG
jgi:hypothetical protein